MEIDEERIRTLTAAVLENLKNRSAAGESFQVPDRSLYGIFKDIPSAIKAAGIARERFAGETLELRVKIIASLRRAVLENLTLISRLAVEETGFGRQEDKIVKNRLAAEMTPGTEDLQPEAFTSDHGLTLVERAPYGVIGAITPSTNPTESIINNGISMLAGGNTVVFNPHPSAKNVSAYTVGLMNEAILKAGGPPNLLCTVAEPSIQSAGELMNHPDIALLVVTGGPAVVKAALRTDKKVIAAGPGNPPCVVDETANLEKAARDIVAGAGFDNNIICICEKEILAVKQITDQLKGEMKRFGAFELDKAQTARITEIVIADPGKKGHEGSPNRKYVGKDAFLIAEAAGIKVPRETRILLCETDPGHPLVWTEQLMPVIPIVRMESADAAIDFAVECEHGFRHTASIHSLNISRLSRMAKIMNCSLFVKNGSNFNGMAAGGAGFTSFTIASPTGEGFTRARSFTRERRCSLIDYFRIV